MALDEVKFIILKINHFTINLYLSGPPIDAVEQVLTEATPVNIIVKYITSICI